MRNNMTKRSSENSSSIMYKNIKSKTYKLIKSSCTEKVN